MLCTIQLPANDGIESQDKITAAHNINPMMSLI
jgi:hypothetical protein